MNEGINNHPLKKFGDKDQEVVLILVEVVALSKMSMAQKFLFSRNTLVECRPLLKTMFGWPEGYCLSSSKGDGNEQGHCWDDAPPLVYLGEW